MEVIVIEVNGVIGRSYRPQDNSYSRDVTHDCDHAYVYLHTFIISCEPYKKQIRTGWELEKYGPRYVMMVKAIDPATGWEYEMMYGPEWLLD